MERAEDWRSAVDPSSGRTYWYHRKTRQSVWTKPQFITDEHSVDLTNSNEIPVGVSEQGSRRIAVVEVDISNHTSSAIGDESMDQFISQNEKNTPLSVNVNLEPEQTEDDVLDSLMALAEEPMNSPAYWPQGGSNSASTSSMGPGLWSVDSALSGSPRAGLKSWTSTSEQAEFAAAEAAAAEAAVREAEALAADAEAKAAAAIELAKAASAAKAAAESHAAEMRAAAEEKAAEEAYRALEASPLPLPLMNAPESEFLTFLFLTLRNLSSLGVNDQSVLATLTVAASDGELSGLVDSVFTSKSLRRPEITPELADFLVVCVLNPSKITEISKKSHRTVQICAAKCLWQLASVKIWTCTSLAETTSWSALSSAQWYLKSNDPITSSALDADLLFIVSGIFALLNVGWCAGSSSNEFTTGLASQLDIIIEQSLKSVESLYGVSREKSILATNSQLNLSEVFHLVTPGTLGCLAVSAQYGNAMASRIITLLALHCLRSEGEFQTMFYGGLLSAVQSAYTAKIVSDVCKEQIQRVMRCIMVISPAARDVIVDDWLNSARQGIRSVSIEGYDPRLLADRSLTRHVYLGPETSPEELADAESSDTLNALVSDGVLDLGGQAPWELNSDDEVDGDIPRDVLFTGLDGGIYRLSSHIVWLQCPGLRDLISDFWNSNANGKLCNGEYLELSLDASNVVLRSVVAVISGSTLFMPPSSIEQVTLVRFAEELEMYTLAKAAATWVDESLTTDNVEVISDYLKSLSPIPGSQLAALQAACQSFLASDRGSQPLKMRCLLSSPTSLMTTRIASPRDNSRASVIDMSPSHMLRDAIVESLQDVNNLLGYSPATSSSTQKPVRDTSVSTDFPTMDALREGGEDDIDAAISAELGDSWISSPEPTTRNRSRKSPLSSPGKIQSGGIYSLLLGASGVGGDGSGAIALPSGNGSRNQSIRPVSKVPGRLPDSAKNPVGRTNMNGPASKQSKSLPPEYNASMSLKPPKELTEAEKRLEEMSKPRSLREPKVRKSAAVAAENASASAQVSPVKDSAPKSKARTIDTKLSSKDLKTAAGMSANSSSTELTTPMKSPPVEPVTPIQPQSKRVSAPTEGDIGEYDPDSSSTTELLPLRSISPTVTHRSITVAQDHSVVDEEADSVRSSLLLLKTRTARGRRRTASASDIQVSHPSVESTTPVHSMDLSTSHGEVSEFVDSSRVLLSDDHSAGLGQIKDDPDMHKCGDCGRTFASESFTKHSRVCRRVFAERRKPFDSAKVRAAAFEDDSVTGSAMSSNTKRRSVSAPKVSSSKAAGGKTGPNWRDQSRTFRDAMRAAREGGSAAPSTPYIDPSLIPCPSCGRRFNEKAAERHIPKCSSIVAKPTTLRRGGGTTASTSRPAPPTPRTQPSTPSAGSRRQF